MAYSPPPRIRKPTAPSPSNWRVSPDSPPGMLVAPNQGKTLIRTYEFSGLPSPETTTSLRIECSVEKAPNGSIYTGVRFQLRPHLYLWPSQHRSRWKTTTRHPSMWGCALPVTQGPKHLRG
jgi:hypothetical protein